MRPWNRGEKLAATAVLLAVVGLPAAYLVVPEVRTILNLDRDVPPTAGTPIFANRLDEMRRRDSVDRMKETESEKPISEIPVGSFGFAHLIRLERSYLEVIRVNPHAPEGRFELHKLGDGQKKLIAYVGPETADRLRSGLSKGQAVTIYSDSWTEASNLLAIPLRSLDCPGSRTLSLDAPKSKYGRLITALDCHAN